MRTNPRDLDDDGNRAGGGTLMPPLRERHPTWFGCWPIIQRLKANNRKRRRNWPGPGLRDLTHRDRSFLHAKYPGRWSRL